MSCYIIGIGGTGHRVINSFIPLAAAGLIDAEKVNILMIDAEDGNGNYALTEDCIYNYMDVKESIGNSTTFFRTELVPVLYNKRKGFPGYLNWSPMAVEDSSGKKSSSKDYFLRRLFNYDYFDSNPRMLMEFLYSSDEMEQQLDKGFYGHPSIGSAIMAKSIKSENPIWNSILECMKGEAANEEVKVMIVGSIFGGTGASGMPVVSTILKNYINSSNLKLGGLLLLPYFKFKKNESEKEVGLKPDSEKFMAKTKSALLYYNSQNYLNIFDYIYTLGDDYEQMSEEEYNSGGAKQQNKANIVELYAALGIAHFLNRELSNRGRDEDKGLHLTTRMKDCDTSKYTWDGLKCMLGQDCIRNSLSQLLRFSVVYSKSYYHGINFVLNHKKDYRGEPWYVSFFKDADGKEDTRKLLDRNSTSLYNFCGKMIEYFKQVHIYQYSDDTGGKFNLSQNIQLFNYAYYDLFNMKYDSNKDINNFEKLVFGSENGKNRAGKINSQICSINYALQKVKRQEPFGDFVEELYKYCVLS